MLLMGCRAATLDCPVATVTAVPAEIPPGANQTDLFVRLQNPFSINGLEVITQLETSIGIVADPSARETNYVCPHDIFGPVQICAHASYLNEDAEDGGEPEGGMSEAELNFGAQGEAPNVGAAYEYLRLPHVRIPDPFDCSETRCTTVICPKEKNVCPVVSSLTVEPMVVPEEGTATIEVVAADPDGNPKPLVTTLSARDGTIDDLHARQTRFTCDRGIGGDVAICVVASDGDPSCDDEQCTTVRCPSEPPENTCPIIEDFTAMPMTIPPFEATTDIRVDAVDPDEYPEPLRTELRSDWGAFEDPDALETTFVCAVPGPARLCVEASDGDDLACDVMDRTRCITVQCPSTVRVNYCPLLFIINPIPRVIDPGATSTMIETRAQDVDARPQPLVLTLGALWGSFENTENIPMDGNAVGQNATYICDRPGPVEICVDATDGACVKTLCDDVVCPDDIATAP
jgi:hypothetical protein